MTRRGMGWIILISVLLLSTGVRAETKKEITVGFALSLTGRFSTDVSDVFTSYQMWAEEVNRQGGILVKAEGRRLPVRLIWYDDQSDASTSAKLYERLILQDRVDLLLSPWGSGINFAVTAITEKLGYPMALTSASADTIYARGFRTVFAVDAMASAHTEAVSKVIQELGEQVRSAAVLYENFLFTELAAKGFKENADRIGLRLVLYERFPLAARDFTSLLVRVKSAQPDAVIVLNIMPAGLYLTRQMREMGIAPKLFFTLIGPAYEREFRQPLGRLAEGILENGDWHPDLPFPGAREYAEKFRARTGKEYSFDGAFAWMVGEILQQAVEKAGTLDRAKITEVLHREEFITIGGRYLYDERGVNKLQERQNFLVQVQGGQRVIVWPPALAKARLRFPVFQP